jgi:putative transposase
VISRGNARQTIFHDSQDFERFSRLVRRAGQAIPMRVLAWCLMPNHFHFVLRPRRDGDLGTWVHWLLTTHTRYHQHRYATSGRIWQGRFKAFPIQADDHLLTVIRYVERNPVRAGLVNRSRDWPWSSADQRNPVHGQPLENGDLLSPSPTELPVPWAAWVDRPLTDGELEAVRECARRERPYGDTAWVHGAADRLGLRSTLVRRGRPASNL